MGKKKPLTSARCVSFEEFQPSLFPIEPTPQEQEATNREGLEKFSQQLEQAYGSEVYKATGRIKKALDKASKEWKH